MYGQFAYLQAHFEQIAGTLDLGASTTYFTQISQDPKRYRAASAVYLVFLAILLVLISLYLVFSFQFGWGHELWPGIPMKSVLWAAVFGFGLYLSRVSVQITDAAGLARRTETLRALRTLLTLGLLFLLYFSEALTLERALAVVAVSYLVFSIVCFQFGHRMMGGGQPDFSSRVWRETARSFWHYGKPLALYSFLVVGSTLFERWLLQSSSGAAQQGYFGVAQQLSLAVFVLANSLTPIFHRESAVAFAGGNFSALRLLFSTYTRRFFALAALPSIFIALNARNLVSLLSGPDYEKGWLAVSLMALYPLHQTTGMLSLTLQFATNRTRSYLVIGLIRDGVGLVLGYFLLAPRNWAIPGLELGAVGLATKFIVCQLINTVLLQSSNCRYLEISYWEQLRSELLLLLGLGSFAWVGAVLGGFIGTDLSSETKFLRLAVSGGLYGLFVLSAFYFYPRALGLRAEEKANLVDLVRNQLRRFRGTGAKGKLGTVH